MTSKLVEMEVIERVSLVLKQMFWREDLNDDDQHRDIKEAAELVIKELGEPTAEMLKGGMEVLEASQKMGEPLEAQVGRVWWEMICIAQPAPGSTQEDHDRWDKIFAEAVAEVRAERT